MEPMRLAFRRQSLRLKANIGQDCIIAASGVLRDFYGLLCSVKACVFLREDLWVNRMASRRMFLIAECEQGNTAEQETDSKCLPPQLLKGLLLYDKVLCVFFYRVCVRQAPGVRCGAVSLR